jgi:hypothetical protein
VTLIPSDAEFKDRAREMARGVLRPSAAFQSMPLADQQSIYLSLVQEYIDDQR